MVINMYFREKRKREREKQKKQKSTKKIIHENGIKSPTRNDQNANQNGKIIFNKFDLIQDPVEKAKLENQVFFYLFLFIIYLFTICIEKSTAASTGKARGKERTKISRVGR